MLVYCDSVILIYYLDAVGAYHQLAAQRLAALHAAGDEVAVSDLVRLECRVKPIQIADQARLAIFDGFFALPDVHALPLTTAVYDRATEIRAQYAIKTMDALHLAAAVEGGCGLLLTHDFRLAKYTGLQVEVVS